MKLSSMFLRWVFMHLCSVEMQHSVKRLCTIIDFLHNNCPDRIQME